MQRNLKIILTQEREKRNLSTKSFAALTKLPESQIYQLESGTITPTITTLKMLSDSLEISLAELMRAAGYKEDAIELEMIKQSQYFDLLKQIYKLSDKDQTFLFHIVSKLLNNSIDCQKKGIIKILLE